MSRTEPDARSKRAIEEERMNREQDQFIRTQAANIKQFIKEQDNSTPEEKLRRARIKDEYNKAATRQKYKAQINQRSTKRTGQQVIFREMNLYAKEMLFLNTDDKILYQYSNKLYRRMQWLVLQQQHLPALAGYLLFKLTRYLRKGSQYDNLYFAAPFLFVNVGLFLTQQRNMWQIGYPAHPYIQLQRTQIINQSCYKYPPILKNEIEYLHRKIHQQSSDDMTDEQLLATRFEKSFQIGKVTVDYKKLLAENYGIRSDNERTDGARFKVIVEGGVLYIQPIDSFESVFELSKEMVTDVSLISILDPFLFDQHKDIVNALFEVYHDLSEQYLLKHSMPIVTLSQEAQKKLNQKYNL